MSLYDRFIQWVRDEEPKVAGDKQSDSGMDAYPHNFGKVVFPIDEFADSERPFEVEDADIFSHHSSILNKVLSWFFTIVLAVMLLVMVADSPISGTRENNPTVNEVSERYIESGVEDTGAINFVAGIILDYRAFDTYGEAAMVFTSIMGVVLLLKAKDPDKKEGEG